MALGDLMASRLSHSSSADTSVVPNHHQLVNDLDSSSNDDSASQRRDSDAASCSYASTVSVLPQPAVLCELRHESFEDYVPAGPSDSGLVSKWRIKDRVCVFLVSFRSIRILLLYLFSKVAALLH